MRRRRSGRADPEDSSGGMRTATIRPSSSRRELINGIDDGSRCARAAAVGPYLSSQIDPYEACVGRAMTPRGCSSMAEHQLPQADSASSIFVNSFH